MVNDFFIRIGNPGDLPELQKLFVNTVTSICKTDYDHEQIEAWVSDTNTNANRQRWLDVLTNQYVLVAQYVNKIIGFASLENGHHIDFLYVHKDHQRQGVATTLYATIESEAKRQQEVILTAEVSKTALSFFEKQAFKVVTKQSVKIKGVFLTNYKMMKMVQ